MSYTGDDPHTLAGAYVLDAVDTADRALFDQHLAGCGACQQEVRGLRETAAALALATAVAPRAALREAVLTAAARTRQLPPLTGAAPQARRSRARAAAASRSRHSAPRLLRWLPGGAGARRLVLGLAGGIAAVAVALGVVSYSGMEHQLDQVRGGDHSVAAVLSAPDASMLTGRVSTGGTVTVVMSHRMRMLVLTAADLQVLPPSQRYELWLMGPEGSRPAGMIGGSGGRQTAGPMLVSGLSEGDSVGMTVEPASGSPQPTSPPILLIALH